MSRSSLAVFWHPDVLKHNTGKGCYEYAPSPLMEIEEPHPENAERVRNIRSALQRGPINGLIDWRPGRHASLEEMMRFHPRSYIEEVIRAEAEGPVRIDGSGTVVDHGTMDACKASAGTCLAALEEVLSEESLAAYALVRPPGHHAGRETPDGSCIFNNLAIAVETALESGCERVAVIDWDVHHGNGTQSGFYDRDDVLTISLHMPLGAWGENHPETGEVDEIGRSAGRGYNLNIPLPYGSGDVAYTHAMETLIAPVVRDFDPDLLVIACGQDANQVDLNGRNLLSMEGFRMLGATARQLAQELCNGRLLLCQEGGYAITYTGFCMYAVAEGVLGVESPMEDPLAYDASIEQPEVPIAAINRIREQWFELTGRNPSV